MMIHLPSSIFHPRRQGGYLLVDDAGSIKPASKTKLTAAIIIGAAAGFTFTLVLVAVHVFFHP
jgi:hypothetical protein